MTLKKKELQFCGSYYSRETISKPAWKMVNSQEMEKFFIVSNIFLKKIEH